MNIDDGILVEAVRSRREVYDKGHPGWKNAAIKDEAWVAIGEGLSARLCSCEIRLGSLLLGLHSIFTCSAAPAADCSARSHTLRERYNKEKRRLELLARSGSAGPHLSIWCGPITNL